MERVIGYREIEIDRIVSRPVIYTGKEDNGFHDLPPVTAKIKVMSPVYENLGPKTFTTVDSDISGMKELPTWGSNTDNATGKHTKK